MCTLVRGRRRPTLCVCVLRQRPTAVRGGCTAAAQPRWAGFKGWRLQGSIRAQGRSSACAQGAAGSGAKRAVGGASVPPGHPVVPASPCTPSHHLHIMDAWPLDPWLAGASLAVPSGHGSATNCLRWHPASEHLLLSASHDPAILLHDLRSPGQPLHRLLGHATGAR